MRGIPGMNVFALRILMNYLFILRKFLPYPSLSIFVIQMTLYFTQITFLVAGPHHSNTDGSDVTIMSYGFIPVAAQVVEMLSSEGISCHHIHVKALKPIDWPVIQTALDRTPITLSSKTTSVLVVSFQ